MTIKIATKTVTIRPGANQRFRPFTIIINCKVSSAKLDKMTPRQIADYTTDKVRMPGNTYTPAERYLLGELYDTVADPTNNSDNRVEIIASFRECFDTHSDESLERMVNQCKLLDRYYNAGGCITTKSQADVMNAINPDRYYTWAEIQEAASLV